MDTTATPTTGMPVATPEEPQRGLAMLLPVSFDYATMNAGFGNVTRSFAPSGRELDAELSYGIARKSSWIGANLYARRQPGHIAAADADVGAAIRYSLGF